MAVPQTSARVAKASALHDCKPAAVLEYCSPTPEQFGQTERTENYVYTFTHCMRFVSEIASELWLLPFLMNAWVSISLPHHLVSKVFDCSYLS